VKGFLTELFTNFGLSKEKSRNVILLFSFCTILISCGGGDNNSGLPDTDSTPPVVVKTIPNSGSIIPINTFITITFNEAIQLPESINVNIYEYNNDGSLDTSKSISLSTTEVPMSLNNSATELTIRPNADTTNNKPFLDAKKYQVNISAIKDKNNNTYGNYVSF